MIYVTDVHIWIATRDSTEISMKPQWEPNNKTPMQDKNTTNNKSKPFDIQKLPFLSCCADLDVYSHFVYLASSVLTPKWSIDDFVGDSIEHMLSSRL